MNIPSPKELDKQCKVKIDKWIDLFSEECKMLDNDHALTVKWYKLCLGENLSHDLFGRIWGIGQNNFWYPYHFSYRDQLIGYKISAKAAN